MSKVTIVDVAKRAAVSIATVSRVINGNYPVKEETKRKVLETMDEMGFVMNRNAHNLKMNHSKLIGIIVADISNPYFMTIAKGVEQVVQNEGYTMIYASSNESFEKETDLLRTFSQYRIDGAILATSCNNTDALNDVLRGGMPTVIVDSLLPGIHADVIAENDTAAMQKLTAYAIGRGHRRICLVNGPLSSSTGAARSHGFFNALREGGINTETAVEIDANFSRDLAARRFEEILSAHEGNPFTAVICANNYMTEGVLSVMISKGIRPGEDMSLASYNELSVNTLMRPQITYLTDNATMIGQSAGEILLKRMTGDRQENQQRMMFNTIFFDKELVEGGTIGEI